MAWIVGTSAEKVENERPEARKTKAGIDIVFDDIEGEVVEPGETPDRDQQ